MHNQVLALASLPLLHWCCCPCCTRAVTGIELVSLMALCWGYCPHHAGILPSMCLHHCPCCTGIPSIVVLVLLPFALMLLPSSCWHLHRHCTGIIALVALVSLLLLHWHCCPCCNDVFALVALAFVPLYCAGVNCPLLRWHLCHC